jgi:hypothetical protein
MVNLTRMGRRRKAHNLRSVGGRIILKWGLKYKIRECVGGVD